MSGLLRKALRDQRRPLIGWGAGLAAIAAMYAAFYPSIRDSAADLQGYIDNLPEALQTVIGTGFTTPAGYLRSETFGTLGPVLFLMYAIGAGARAIAAEEEAGTLDLLLSTPVSRGQVLASKATGILVTTAAFATILCVTLATVGPPFDLTVPVGDIAAACLMLLLLALAFGALALAVGSATGRHGAAQAVVGAIAVFTFILNALAPTVEALEPLRPLSPFYWYIEPDPLTSGIVATNGAVLVSIAVLGYAVAAITLNRRDLAS